MGERTRHTEGGSRGRVPRAFADELTPPRTPLSRDELHHLRRVLRLGDGDSVRLFDAHGHETVGRLAGDAVEHAPPEHRPREVSLHIASAVPKGDRALWLVEKLGELGVVSWTPLVTEHSDVDPRGGKLDKLRRRAIEAAKQADTPGVMAVNEPTPLLTFLDSATAESTTLHVLSTADAAPPRPGVGGEHTLLVGPEGGWSAGEWSMMSGRGIAAVTLGGTVLRIETAAVVGAGVFAHLLRGG